MVLSIVTLTSMHDSAYLTRTRWNILYAPLARSLNLTDSYWHSSTKESTKKH